MCGRCLMCGPVGFLMVGVVERTAVSRVGVGRFICRLSTLLAERIEWYARAQTGGMCGVALVSDLTWCWHTHVLLVSRMAVNAGLGHGRTL